MDGSLAINSTNVRSYDVAPPEAPRLLRAGFATAAAISPSLAARAAEVLFLRPPRRKPSRREEAALAAGEPFVVEVGRERLRAWRFGEGPAVLLAHGWGGRGGQLAALVPPLAAAGCSAVAFDAPAHGASTGRLASGIAFAEAISAVAARTGARAAVGHSMGAAALGWAVAEGLALDAAVMVSPPSGVARFFRRFCDGLALSRRVEDSIRERLRRRLGVTPEEFDLVRRTGQGATPLLVVHDRDDAEVPWTDGEAIARAWPGARLSSTSGLGHRGVLRDASVTASIASFVEEHLARCSCGRLAVERRPDVGPVCAGCALDRELYDRPSRW
jgi:pimeloyl-ACP methyl ester carboxylesterase